MSCKQANAIDLVTLLEVLGYYPQKVKNDDYWYLSPLRTERTPSFKVNRKLNVWFDFGDNRSGNLVDFGILYFSCPVKTLLQKLSNMGSPGGLMVQQPAQVRGSLIIPGTGTCEKKDASASRIIVFDSAPLHSPALLKYLQQRAIPPDLAQDYCRQIWYRLYDKTFFAIGFPNDGGGYELRNPHFKGSSSPKTSSFIDNKAATVEVFEGFFSFLSYLVIRQHSVQPPSNYLVLNSLGLFNSSRQLMEQHQEINLYLDRDNAGDECTQKALAISNRYRDRSGLYEGFKDCNHFLVVQQTKLLNSTAELVLKRSIYHPTTQQPDNGNQKKRRIR